MEGLVAELESASAVVCSNILTSVIVEFGFTAKIMETIPTKLKETFSGMSRAFTASRSFAAGSPGGMRRIKCSSVTISSTISTGFLFLFPSTSLTRGPEAPPLLDGPDLPLITFMTCFVDIVVFAEGGNGLGKLGVSTDV